MLKIKKCVKKKILSTSNFVASRYSSWGGNMKKMAIFVSAIGLAIGLSGCTMVMSDGSRIYCEPAFVVVSTGRDGTSVVRYQNGRLQVVATSQLRSMQERSGSASNFNCRTY